VVEADEEVGSICSISFITQTLTFRLRNRTTNEQTLRTELTMNQTHRFKNRGRQAKQDNKRAWLIGNNWEN